MAERVIMITGATGSLGPAVVQSFRDSGDTVVTVARRNADITADLTVEPEVSRTVDEVLRTHDRIDAVIHAMGGFAMGGRIEETDFTVWRQMLDVNFLSAVHVLKYVTPPMRRAGRGRIIAVGSRAGLSMTAGLAAYSATKAALHALIQTSALELAGSGVTANAVLPANIRSNTQGGTRPESIAAVIQMLASEAARDVNGALIPVYGES